MNRFSLVFIELPHVVRNFTEDKKDNADSLNVIFTNKPVRLGVNLRERLRPNVWLRVEGEVVPEFTIAEEEAATGQIVRSESAKARSLAGWVEYSWSEQHPLPERSAVGIEGGYHMDERSEGLRGSGSLLGSRTAFDADKDDQSPQRLDRHVLMEFDKDLYWISADDSIIAWRSTRTYAKPYAWVVINDAWTLRAAVQFERREIIRVNRQSVKTTIENRYIAPMAGARWGLGARRQSIVEFGWASLFRQREEHSGAGASTTDFNDHRLYVAFEYAFSPNKFIRLVESFELNKRDRGQYGIHDHGFFQMIFGF